MLRNGVPEDRIELFIDLEKGMERALEIADNGDLLVVFAGRYYDKDWETIKKYHQSIQGNRVAH